METNGYNVYEPCFSKDGYTYIASMHNCQTSSYVATFIATPCEYGKSCVAMQLPCM